MKNMGDKGRKILRKLLNEIMSNRKKREDWELGVIIPLYKKGDNKECSNYREFNYSVQ